MIKVLGKGLARARKEVTRGEKIYNGSNGYIFLVPLHSLSSIKTTETMFNSVFKR